MSIALLGAYQGFYATQRRERLRGYLLMHAASGLGFLCKSAAAWMVPAMTLVTLVIWERRWRELLRWELYLGLVLQAAMIVTWIWFVYVGPDGPAHLKVFFWNNLVGRFTRVDAPNELQYAAAHRNSPGKYLLELPLYLAPWTLLVVAAVRRAWRRRKRLVRLTIGRCASRSAASLPPLVFLSLAATARNIYLAPALPGVALLLAWWAQESWSSPDRWDVRALRATSVLLLLGVALFRRGSGHRRRRRLDHDAIACGLHGDFRRRTDRLRHGLRCGHGRRPATALSARQWALLLGLLRIAGGPGIAVVPARSTLGRIWQSIARAVEHDAVGKPLVLFAPDETTRAMIDMYSRTDVG